MNNQNLLPNQSEPILRVAQGIKTALLAELTEATLSGSSGITSSSAAETGGELWDIDYEFYGLCSYDGDDAD
ncbi:MAG: DUF5837 family protein [Nodosilinea sp. LVE1205-7]